jgi:crotonobetainyl-CoA:carnitine CoA-transferase CaiB-like acyl-CoA transferase
MMRNEDRYWAACTDVLGLSEAQAEFADPQKRRGHWDALGEVFAEAIGRCEHDDLVRRLSEGGCIFSGYATPQDVLQDPAAAANGYLMTHPVNPKIRIGAAPMQFDDTPAQIRRPAPRIGEDSQEILTDLGYSAAEADGLIGSGAVAAAPARTNPA